MKVLGQTITNDGTLILMMGGISEQQENTIDASKFSTKDTRGESVFDTVYFKHKYTMMPMVMK